MKVLVVDDNQFLASTILDILEDKGFEVKSAKDGREGYRIYLLFKPDLVITDIQMPEENGLEMMKNIRTHEPMIRTIYMSADLSAFRASLIEEKKLYPVRCFQKPFSLEMLKNTITESTANSPLHNSSALPN